MAPRPRILSPWASGNLIASTSLPYRSDDAVNHGTPACLARRAISRASSSDAASGLSIQSGLPHARACFTCSRCWRPSTLSIMMPSTFWHSAGISGTNSTFHLVFSSSANLSTRLKLSGNSLLPPLKAATTCAPAMCCGDDASLSNLVNAVTCEVSVPIMPSRKSAGHAASPQKAPRNTRRSRTFAGCQPGGKRFDSSALQRLSP